VTQRIQKIETVYVSRDNLIEWVLYENDAIYLLAPVTRWQINLDGSQIVDSQTDPTCFDASAGSGVLRMKLGRRTVPITVGRYDDAKLVVYTAINTNGVIWQDGLSFNVKAG